MSENLWARFEGIAGTDEVATERAKFAPLEVGTYNMKLEKIEAGESTQGLPMLKAQFRTDSNRVVFYNQLLQNINMPEMTAANIAKAVEFVGSLVGAAIEYTSMGRLARDIENVQTGKMYSVKVTYGKKDESQKYPILTILGISEEDLPF